MVVVHVTCLLEQRITFLLWVPSKLTQSTGLTFRKLQAKKVQALQLIKKKAASLNTFTPLSTFVNMYKTAKSMLVNTEWIINFFFLRNVFLLCSVLRAGRLMFKKYDLDRLVGKEHTVILMSVQCILLRCLLSMTTSPKMGNVNLN